MADANNPAAAPSDADSAVKEEPGRFAQWQMSAALFVAWFIVDHATKWWAFTALRGDGFNGPVIHLIPNCLALRYAENTGAAFSMFTGKVFALGFVSLAATIGLGWFWWSLPAKEKWGRAATALILSGAVGNMIDRFARGYVVDFILAYWRDHYWPTFNIADTCICVGAGILAIRLLKGKI